MSLSLTLIVALQTWEEFRHSLAREVLGLLRTGARRGAFVERRNADYLATPSADVANWYDDFRQYQYAAVVDELTAASKALAGSPSEDLRSIGESLLEMLEAAGPEAYAAIYLNVGDRLPSIRQAIDARTDQVGRILTKTRNVLTHADRGFPDQLREQVARQLSGGAQDEDDEEDPDAAFDDEEEQAAEPAAGRTVSRKEALRRLERALKAFARARALGRSVPEKSQNGALLAWLGPDRLPAEEDVRILGTLLLEQAGLRRFDKLEQVFLRSIATRYKRFRSERLRQGLWYRSAPPKSSDILWQELDMVILANLQVANELLIALRRRNPPDIPSSGVLAAVHGLHRAQIVVDEATDFSPVQLASMYELAHPAMRSFFLCGDINQRLTTWGLRSGSELDWVSGSIERKTITVSYRQSRRLVDLAAELAGIGGVEAEDVVLPDRLDTEGVAPVWQAGLADTAAIARWLKQRIHEIDRIVQRTTTIAVLVNSEDQVEPTALALNECLEEISLAAVACKDGKVVGNDRDVRVFNVQHIKGLEFEAVFFVGLDQTIETHPDLFPKFLYVGATRAATYLGITFRGNVPTLLEPLAPHFGQDWQL